MMRSINDISGPFCRVSWETINLNSPDQIKQYLLSKGWQPTTWNYKKDGKRFALDEQGNKIKTSPQLTEDSYESVTGEIPSLVARRNVLIHRQRLIKNTRKDDEEVGWINLLRDDGRLEARGIPNATNTGRYRHSVVVNVPNPYAVLGNEIRALFVAAEGYEFVGIDAKALEARVQAHYIFPYKGGQELADLLINGDIHTENQQLWGMSSRNDAKSPYYALMYGALPPKLAETMNCSLKEAQERFDMFWARYTPLAQFRDAIQEVWKSRGGKSGGYLKGLDGRKLFARSPHALVNMMFQSAGSIVVKLATVLTDKWCEQLNLDSHQVIHMHDEFQRETLIKDVALTKELACKAFPTAGQYFSMNVPILGDAKSGKNWAETH